MTELNDTLCPFCQEAEIRAGSAMCQECYDTSDKCASCGVPLIAHRGLYGTCAELQEARARIKELEARNPAHGGGQ